MEQCDNQSWYWRQRVVGGEWGAVERAAGELECFALASGRLAVEVEWCEEGGEWQAAVAHELGLGVAEFEVRAKRQIDLRGVHESRACAVVRGHPSGWRLELPGRVLAAGEAVVVRGVGVSYGVGQVLRVAGDFRCEDDNFTVENAGESQAALLPVVAAVPGALPFTGSFIVKTGQLRAAEVALLQQHAAEICQQSKS